MSITELIIELQNTRKSKVITYITADRQTFPVPLPGFSTQISSDAHHHILNHLKKIEEKQKGQILKIDLLIYTRGGSVDAVLPLVNLFRNFSKNFNVLVPLRAHSAGTLICLGADEIVMTRMAELSPIDPTTANQFNPITNPQDPNSPPKGISVEDVASYFKLALAKKEQKDRIKILDLESEVSMLEVFKELTKNVHPLALGNVYRVYSQIRLIAEFLIKKNPKTNDMKIGTIIKALVEDYFSHSHSLDANEMQKILGKTIVKKADSKEEIAMMRIMDWYFKVLKIEEKFSPREFIGSELEKDLKVTGAYIHSEYMSHAFETNLKIKQRPNLPPNVNIQTPPGAPIPLVPNYPSAVDVEAISLNWKQL